MIQKAPKNRNYGNRYAFKGFKKIMASCGLSREDRTLALSITSPPHEIDHADVRMLHRKAMDILERAFAKITVDISQYGAQ